MVLSEDGHCLYASDNCLALTTHSRRALIGERLTSLMHYDDLAVFLPDFRINMASGTSWTFHHRLRRNDDSFAVFESSFRPFRSDAFACSLGLSDVPMCMVVMRPYPTQAGAELDTFLELETARIFLQTQLEELKREEEQSEKQAEQSKHVHFPIDLEVPRDNEVWNPLAASEEYIQVRSHNIQFFYIAEQAIPHHSVVVVDWSCPGINREPTAFLKS